MGVSVGLKDRIATVISLVTGIFHIAFMPTVLYLGNWSITKLYMPLPWFLMFYLPGTLNYFLEKNISPSVIKNYILTIPNLTFFRLVFIDSQSTFCIYFQGLRMVLSQECQSYHFSTYYGGKSGWKSSSERYVSKLNYIIKQRWRFILQLPHIWFMYLLTKCSGFVPAPWYQIIDFSCNSIIMWIFACYIKFNLLPEINKQLFK